MLLGQPQHPGDLVAAAREHDRLGQGTLERRGVRRVRHEVVLARQNVLRPDQLAQRVEGERHGREGTIGADGGRLADRGVRALRARSRAARPSATADRAACSSPGCTARSPRRCSSRAASLDRVAAADSSCAIVLCANPDGVADGTRQNARGVDLNRNFPATSWRAGTTPSYPAGIDPAERVPANRTNVSSTGSAPLSEPESAGLAALIERLEPALVLDLHAPLELVLTTAARARRGRARAGRQPPGSSSPTSSDRRCRARCATGSATAACPASPTRSSTPGCRRSTARHLPGLVAFTRMRAASRD